VNPKKRCLDECNRFRDLVDSSELGLNDRQLLLVVKAFRSLRTVIRESLEAIPFCGLRMRLWELRDSLEELLKDPDLHIVDGDGNGLYGCEAKEFVQKQITGVQKLIDICGQYID